MKLSPGEQKIFALIEPVANNLGYELVDVNLQNGNRKVLDIAIDRIDGVPVSIEDCKNASNNFSAILDVEDIIFDKYLLEVRSAGVERPLVKLVDFDKFKDRLVSIKLHNPFNGAKRFEGRIVERNGEIIKLMMKDMKEPIAFEYSNIKTAKLVFTNEMFREALAKHKAAGKEIAKCDKKIIMK